MGRFPYCNHSLPRLEPPNSSLWSKTGIVVRDGRSAGATVGPLGSETLGSKTVVRDNSYARCR